MERVPSIEIADRIVALQALLAEREIDAAIIRQNADLFYFTGTVQDSHLIVPVSGGPVLLVRRDISRAEAESPIRPIIPMTTLTDLRNATFDACSGTPPVTIGFELDVLPANLFFVYDEKIFPKQRIVDISDLVRQVRSVKSAWEVEMMRRAAAISRLVAESVPKLLKPGVTELELAADLEAIARKAGNTGMLRMRSFNLEMGFGHILSGPNGAVPSYTDSPTGGPGLSPAFGQGAGDRQIRAREIVSVDIMTCFGGYINDQTRNFCIGPPPARLAEAYSFVKSAHERLHRIARPGATAGKIYETVVQWAEDAGWGAWFMGHARPGITFVGHGIGLEVDEFPFIAQGHSLPLQEGMTFAFEPKVIIPDEGIAGLENTYLVVGDGIESLNTASEELLVI
ncbi:MAG: Xaa-Pro peptidase family protein [Desulfobacteraceae bacterium]|nr:Xaa-Pro peptidase family protein [Desulfobacteraceae bacterium]